MIKFKLPTQMIAATAATMSLVCGGFHFGWPSPALPKLLAADSDVPITSDESAWIVSLFTVGSAIGPLIGAVLVDRLGRKWTLLSTVIPYLGSSILIAVAGGFWCFIVARIIAGLAVGIMYAVLPMYLGEIADIKMRGALGIMITPMANLGVLISYCVGPWVSRAVLAVVGAIMPIIFALMFYQMPESPYFLIMKEKPERAEKSLLWLRGTTDVSRELKIVVETVALDRQNNKTIKDLVTSPGNRKALVIVIVLMIAQQFSGNLAILSYIGLIFEASGATLNSSIAVIIVGVVQVLGPLLSFFTVDSVGRRPLLLFSISASIFFLSGEALYFQLQHLNVDVSSLFWLPVTAMVGYVGTYTIGLDPIPFVIVSEMFPCNLKALATMVLAISAALSAMIVTKLFQVVADGYGIHVTFWGFAICTVFSGIFVYFVLPETKQRSFRDIQDELHKVGESKIALEKTNV